MITCLEKCEYQKNGECTYELISKISPIQNSNCAYFKSASINAEN